MIAPFKTATVLDSPAALGPVVRARRKSQALRIDDAAGLVGVSVDLLSRLENAQGSVRLDKAMAVLDGLGLALMVVPKEHPWALQARNPGRTAPDETAGE
jgi:transcriptional regulator with XRE-family HTH domain